MARRFAKSSLFRLCFLTALFILVNITVAFPQVSSSVSLTSDHAPANASVVGEAVVFTVDVTDTSAPPAGTPTGRVTIRDGTVVIGSATLNAGGQATFATALLRGGAHTINAYYEGDATFPVNLVPGTLIHTVTTGARTVDVTVGLSPNPVGVGASSTVTANVTDAATNPGPPGVKGAFTPLVPVLGTARTGHTATLLPNGTVWVAGGIGASGALSSTEVYDPATGFSAGPPFPGPVARAGHTATLLQDGTVLIVGGSSTGSPSDLITTAALIYDPAQGTIVQVTGPNKSLHFDRMNHTATLLPNGKVLIAGGVNSSGAPVLTTELFDVSSNFSDGPALPAGRGRSGHTTTYLPNGAILFAGGDTPGTAQLYAINAAGTAWVATVEVAPGLTIPRTAHTATLLLDGNVLITGGSNGTLMAVNSTELYDGQATVPAFVSISAVLDSARAGHTATLLNDGRVLILGGSDATTPTPVILDSGILYTPSFDPQGTVTLSSDNGGGTPVDAVTPLAGCALVLSGTGSTSCAGTVIPGNVGTTPATPHVITGAYAGDNVHTANTNTNNLTVLKGTPVITWANPASITYGTPLNTTDHLNAVISVPGTPVYTPTAGAVLLPGTGQTLHLVFTPTDTANYDTVTKDVTVDVNTKGLTITGVTANNKPYDGNATATLNTSGAVLVGVVGSDVVTPDPSAATATFANSAVGNGKAVTASGFAITGANAAFYTLAQPSGLTADITAKDLTVVGVAASDKIYDGNTTATLNTAGATFVGVIAPDVVTVNSAGATGAFNDKNVGIGKPVAGSGFAAGGADAANYHVVQPTGIPASISALAITGHITAGNKVYDGTTAATISTRTLTGAISGDAVSYTGGTATFADSIVGSGKTVSATGLVLSGTDAPNYTVNSTATASADITPLALTGSITAANKVYDGNKTATINSRVLTGVIAPDIVGYIGGTATFSDKNIGTGKTVTATGLSLNGADAGNYTVNTTAITTADITGVPVTGSITVSSKVYDGTTAATIATRTLTGVVPGDDVTYAGGTATFGDKNIASAKTVTATGLNLTGADAGNYTVNNTATATADITPATLTVTATGVNKVYDATTGATVTLGDNRFGSDVLTTSYTTAGFADKTVGTSKTVSVSGISIAGTDAANYTANTIATATANITALAITGQIVVSNKVYDATTSATITARSLSGVLGSDAVTLTAGTATFDSKNVGAGKTVTATGLTLSGADAANYSTSATLTTTASITPAPTTTNLSGISAITRDGKYQVTAKVTWQLSSESPAGAVTFTDNGTTLQTVTLDGSGQATLGPIAVPLAAGQHSIKASYAPDANLGKNFGASDSVMAVMVTPAVSTQPGRVVLQSAAVTSSSAVSLVQCRVDSLAPVAPPTTLFPACDVDPKSLPSGSSTLTVKVQTVSGSSAALTQQRMFYAMWLGVTGIVALPFAGISSTRRERRRKTLAWLGLALILAACFGAVACGGGFSNPKELLPSVGGPGATQPGQYVVIVSGVDAGLKSVVVASIPVNVSY